MASLLVGGLGRPLLHDGAGSCKPAPQQAFDRRPVNRQGRAMDTDFARRCSALAVLSGADLQALLTCARRRSVRAGEDVLHQGQHNASLFIVQEGVLHVHRDTAGRRVFLGRLEVGSVFGEVSLFDPALTTATVTAESDGRLIEIGREHLERFAAQRPAAAVQMLTALLAQVAKRLRATDARLVDSVVWGGLAR
jgi:CRP-like cAMP-binding protein